MTAQQKSALRLGVLTTVLGGLLLLALSKAAGQVVLRPEFEAAQTRLEVKMEQVEGIAKDVLCASHPQHWRCR